MKSDGPIYIFFSVSYRGPTLLNRREIPLFKIETKTHPQPPLPAYGQAQPPPFASAPPLPPPDECGQPQPHMVKIFCRANEAYNLTIRNYTVVLVIADIKDKFQRWIRYNTEIKDEDGFLAFSLVNKLTGQSNKALFWSLSPCYPDESVLWTETRDIREGFRGIRMVNNISLHFDACNGDKNHEGVHDGTGLQLFKWWKGDKFNQQWKILPWWKVGCGIRATALFPK